MGIEIQKNSGGDAYNNIMYGAPPETRSPRRNQGGLESIAASHQSPQTEEKDPLYVRAIRKVLGPIFGRAAMAGAQQYAGLARDESQYE
jgi:hypothetical protein